MKELKIHLSDEQKEGLDRITWGVRNRLFLLIIDELNYILDEVGETGLKLILEQKVSFIDLKEFLQGQKEHETQTSSKD